MAVVRVATRVDVLTGMHDTMVDRKAQGPEVVGGAYRVRCNREVEAVEV